MIANMMNNHRHKARLLLLMALMLTLTVGCSTTKHLPEGEQLYTGVKRLDVLMADTVDASIITAVKECLEVEPNSSLFGSAYHQSPFPLGLWIYNGLYTERDKGIRHWLWNKFKSDPTLISQVNPVLRCQAAEVAMHDEGYFDGAVDYELEMNKKNARKASIIYKVDYGRKSLVSDVSYLPSSDARIDSIVNHTISESCIASGKRFSASDLENERQRLAQTMVDSGYYNYRPQYVHFFADSTQSDHSVAIRVASDFNADTVSIQPCRIDSVLIKLDYGYGMPSTEFVRTEGKTVAYRGPLGVKPKYLFDCMNIGKGELFSTTASNRVLKRLARLNTFKYNSVEWVQLPSSADTTSLLLKVNSTYDYPWTGSLEMKAAYKDNKQVGPGVSFVAQRRNIFHGGELLRMELTAGYEWNTGKQTIGNKDGLLNSYEFGGRVSLAVPRLQLPLRFDKELPVTTNYAVSADLMRRSGFFQMLKSTIELSYQFSSNNVSTHVLTPFQLTYTSLISKTDKFEEIVSNNRVLRQSFANQFIPSIKYNYIYDNRSEQYGRSYQWMQFSITEAGALLDALMGKVGSHRQQGERQLFWQKFSQFLKLSADLRNYLDLGNRHVLAARLYGGVAYAYGNSSTIPYSEQFFIGGANSLRGFSIRGIGPGTYCAGDSKYSYMDRTGDLKFEANLEWRFPVSGDLNAALFADAGNIWTLRNDDGRSGSQISKRMAEQLATDCGLGLRYDLGMLVVRFDVGVPLHDPAEDDGKYYNISGSFFGNLGYHLAIGYPF